LRVAEECEEIEVVKRRYRPRDDGETVVILRLRGFEGKSDSSRVSGGMDVDGQRAFIECRSCG